MPQMNNTVERIELIDPDEGTLRVLNRLFYIFVVKEDRVVTLPPEAHRVLYDTLTKNGRLLRALREHDKTLKPVLNPTFYRIDDPNTVDCTSEPYLSSIFEGEGKRYRVDFYYDFAKTCPFTRDEPEEYYVLMTCYLVITQ